MWKRVPLLGRVEVKGEGTGDEDCGAGPGSLGLLKMFAVALAAKGGPNLNVAVDEKAVGASMTGRANHHLVPPLPQLDDPSYITPFKVRKIAGQN